MTQPSSLLWGAADKAKGQQVRWEPRTCSICCLVSLLYRLRIFTVSTDIVPSLLRLG